MVPPQKGRFLASGALVTHVDLHLTLGLENHSDSYKGGTWNEVERSKIDKATVWRNTSFWWVLLVKSGFWAKYG